MKTYHLIVKTKQRDESVEAVGESLDTLLVKTRATPIENKANVAVIKAISDYLGVAKRRVVIKSGAHSSMKTVVVED